MKIRTTNDISKQNEATEIEIGMHKMYILGDIDHIYIFKANKQSIGKIRLQDQSTYCKTE